MKILILGYSDIVKRRVIPSLMGINQIESIDISSKSSNIKQKGKISNLYKDYDDALIKSEAELVYISLPNSLHYPYLIKTLKNNKNVIVDKPAITKLNQLKKIEDIIKKKQLGISMSSVFQHHKCWKKFKSISLKNSKEGTLVANFTIPKLNKDNIRMSKRLDGGAFHDMAIYASSAGYLFWETPLQKLSLFKSSENGLVTGFNILINYGRGKEFVGRFGFNRTYTNQIQYHGLNFSTKYDRVFSPPPNLDTYITKETKNKGNKNYVIGYDDSFKNYLTYVIKYLNNDRKQINREFFNQNYEYQKLLSQ